MDAPTTDVATMDVAPHTRATINRKEKTMATEGSGLWQPVRAEFTKLRTIRSTTWTLLATVVGTILVTVLSTHGLHPHGPSVAQFDPTNQSLSGIALGQLTIGFLWGLL